MFYKCKKCGEMITAPENDQKMITCSNCGASYKNPNFQDEIVTENEENEADEFAFSQNNDPDSESESKTTKTSIEQTNLTNQLYEQVAGSTLREFFKMRQYKRVNPVLAVFTGILLSPFLVLVLAMSLFYYCTLFVIKAVSCPASFLSIFMRNESNKTAVQCVIYFVGFPMLFLLKTIEAFLSTSMFLIYFVLSTSAFIFSCGGIKYQPFLFDADTNMRKTFKTETATKKSQIVASILVGVAYLMIIVLILCVCFIMYDSNTPNTGIPNSSDRNDNTTSRLSTMSVDEFYYLPNAYYPSLIESNKNCKIYLDNMTSLTQWAFAFYPSKTASYNLDFDLVGVKLISSDKLKISVYDEDDELLQSYSIYSGETIKTISLQKDIEYKIVIEFGTSYFNAASSNLYMMIKQK